MPIAATHWTCSRYCYMHITHIHTHKYTCISGHTCLHSGNVLEFLELGTSSNVERQYLAHVENTVSSRIPIDMGFAFGNTTQQSVYVSH